MTGNNPSRMEIWLPYPPSENNLFATNWKTKRRYKTAKYNQWLADAGWTLKMQKYQRYPGKIVVSYFARKVGNKRKDIHNLGKALHDFLVRHQIIVDDSYITDSHCAWDERIPASQVKLIVEAACI